MVQGFYKEKASPTASRFHLAPFEVAANRFLKEAHFSECTDQLSHVPQERTGQIVPTCPLLSEDKELVAGISFE
ncbi:Inactive Ubiquitin Carboxyl-Terminal Hydrolase 17-Like Protein 4 [Manis pentadactyla]|nr:Inactive Ubiquitin Carboxyl-Terminal Hydrolase 17-Like Protein 4 [Manis pentadactyla]